MSKIVQIKKTEIGSGIPKICVPVTGKTKNQIMKQLQGIAGQEPDLVEWRADCFEAVDNHEEVKKMLMTLSDKLGDIPLLFTFRTLREGGERQISLQDYVNLNKMVSKTGFADLVDVEVFFENCKMFPLIEEIRQNGVSVVGSNHHFNSTPSLEELLTILQKIDQAQADILKVAVMPRDAGDVLTLLTATNRMSQLTDKPLITMSMGGQGAVSRISGEIFGSAVTFGCVEEASAPGQIELKELRKTLVVLHQSIAKS